jgi:hypothetical protein
VASIKGFGSVIGRGGVGVLLPQVKPLIASCRLVRVAIALRREDTTFIGSNQIKLNKDKGIE